MQNKHVAILLGAILFAGLILSKVSFFESDLEKAAKEFKKTHCNQWGLTDIWYGNRFGEPVISIDSPSEADRDSLKTILPDSYKGFRVYISAPIWGIGGLSLDSADTKLWMERVFISPYNVYGSPEQKEMEKVQEKIIERDKRNWELKNQNEKIEYIANYIKKKRMNQPRYANCGDKYIR